jgi:hypothetical protein
MMTSYDDFRTRVVATTIDGTTLLSTDYFNIFNEVTMLLGMLPDMPEMLEDIAAWRFRSYAEHFRDSGLPFAPLAIEAYAQVPPATRERFEETIAQLRARLRRASPVPARHRLRHRPRRRRGIGPGRHRRDVLTAYFTGSTSNARVNWLALAR